MPAFDGVIASCGARKLTQPARASDLYIGPYARAAIGYAKSSRVSVKRIISAKYGLIPLDQVVAPYNTTWDDSVDRISFAALSEQVRLLGTQHVFLIAGEKYAEVLRACGMSLTAIGEVIVGDGRMGCQLRWLKSHV